MSGGGIYGQQGGVRGVGNNFFDDFDDFFQLIHQSGFVLQASGRIDKYNIIALFQGFFQSVEAKCRGITAVGPLINADIVSLSPDFKLFNGGRAESVSGNEADLMFVFQFCGKFSDCGGLAGSVDPNH